MLLESVASSIYKFPTFCLGSVGRISQENFHMLRKGLFKVTFQPDHKIWYLLHNAKDQTLTHFTGREFDSGPVPYVRAD